MPNIIYKPKGQDLPEEMHRALEYHQSGASFLFRTSDGETRLMRGSFSKTETLTLCKWMKHVDEAIIYMYGPFDDKKRDIRNIQPYSLVKGDTASTLVYYDGTITQASAIPGYEEWMTDQSVWFNLTFRPLMGEAIDDNMLTLFSMLGDRVATLIVTPDWNVRMLGKNRWFNFKGIWVNNEYTFNSGTLDPANYKHSDAWRGLWKVLSAKQ